MVVARFLCMGLCRWAFRVTWILGPSFEAHGPSVWAVQGKARDLPQSQGDTRRWNLGEVVHMLR